MNVILLEQVRNLGNLGEQVSVKAGYARNYLYPTGKAIPATDANLQEFQSRRAELEKKAAASLTQAQAQAKVIGELNLTIPAKASDEGKLFGSVGVREIALALADAGVEVEKNAIQLPTGPIRQTGEFEVEVLLHNDVTTNLKLSVVGEK